MSDFWARMAGRGPQTVIVAGTPLRAGSRVRLRPRAGADVFDLVLGGRVAVVEAVEQDDQGEFHLAVTLVDDPGRDLGEARLPGHRFFYAPDEVEPIGGPDEHGDVASARRVLVAGIGNIFLGDDAFGLEVVRRLAAGPPIPGADVVDFGIRGMDLAYALQRDYQGAILIDAAPRGETPGTLTVLEADLIDGAPAVETHGMDPVRVLRLARELGRVPPRVLVLCCEPATVPAGAPEEDVLVALSEPVREAVGPAADLARSLVADLTAAPAVPGPPHDGLGGR
jgi:hydrogenase maturation protease